MSREHKVGWFGFVVLLVALVCYCATAACAFPGRTLSPDVGLTNDRSTTEVESSGPVAIDKRTASPDVKADVSAGAPQQSGASDMKADNGGIAERTDQQAQGIVTIQTAGMTIGALCLWLLHGYKQNRLAEEHQTERMRIIGKANEQLLKLVHGCHTEEKQETT